VSALTRKLLRELVTLRGQVIAIAVVIAGGVATLMMFLTALFALTETRDAFYQEYRFADLFASAERAPRGLVAEIERIDGVQRVEDRVVTAANLDVPGYDNPVTGRILSLPEGRQPDMNRLHLRQGRLPEPDREAEVVISDAFAEAHGLRPGDDLAAIIRGRYQRLEVVGVAVSPEFIYQIRPGEILPDYERYGILWMNRRALAAAYDMDGAFNDLLLILQHGARPGDVIEAVDRLLEPWGGRGAHDRGDQLSHALLEDELTQLANLAYVIPAIFLGVAAFLLNVVVSRLVATQREIIGALKAFGYSRLAIAGHYVRLVLLIVVLGVLAGVAAGYWLGVQLAEIYAGFFRFPFLEFRLQPPVVAIAAAVTTLSALLGTWLAVRRAARLPPAEAMRPEPPPTYRPTLIERLGLQRWFSQPTRMILRGLERRPLRAGLATVGIALAVAILMIGPYQRNALNTMIDVQFNLVQRDDVTVSFYEPTSRKAVHELAGLPGVDRAEPFRQVAAEVAFGHRSHRMAVLGLERDADLRRLLDTDLRAVPLPGEGVLLTDYLAEQLQVGPGDTLEIRVLEGRRQTLEVPVSGVIAEYLGVSVYMELDALNRLLGEGEAISGAWLGLAGQERGPLLRELDRRPRVAGATEADAAMRNFEENVAGTMMATAAMTTLLAGAIAFGVVYNNARIALAERGRELASLRVLGFTRREIAYLLLGEQAVLIAAALPIGFVIGHYLYAIIVQAAESELYRVPMIPSAAGMALATLVLLGVAGLSAWVVRRRLDRLDMVEALKSRE